MATTTELHDGIQIGLGGYRMGMEKMEAERRGQGPHPMLEPLPPVPPVVVNFPLSEEIHTELRFLHNLAEDQNALIKALDESLSRGLVAVLDAAMESSRIAIEAQKTEAEQTRQLMAQLGEAITQSVIQAVLPSINQMVQVSHAAAVEAMESAQRRESILERILNALENPPAPPPPPDSLWTTIRRRLFT